MQLRMELFRRNNEVWRVFIVTGDIINAYLGYNNIPVQQLVNTALPVKEISGKVYL
jgi:hypothetical protein